jgi:hypothetical protein
LKEVYLVVFEGTSPEFASEELGENTKPFRQENRTSELGPNLELSESEEGLLIN